ncbi:MAG: hypothetical protein RL456_2738, partial [Pseudomonadota bacterium]
LAIAAVLVLTGIALTVRARRAWQRERAQLKRAQVRARVGSPADGARRVC